PADLAPQRPQQVLEVAGPCRTCLQRPRLAGDRRRASRRRDRCPRRAALGTLVRGRPRVRPGRGGAATRRAVDPGPDRERGPGRRRSDPRRPLVARSPVPTLGAVRDRRARPLLPVANPAALPPPRTLPVP